MNGEQFLHGLQFNEGDATHEHVQSKPTIKGQSFVVNGDWNRSLDGQTPLLQFVGKAGFVYAFQQSRPEGPVHLDRRIHDEGSHFLFIF